MSISVGIVGTGASLPEDVVSNPYFVERGLDTSDDWIESRTGIKTRRIAKPDQKVSYFAHKAAERAIESACIDRSEIGMLIVATSTPDYQGFPSTACVVHQLLGLPETCGAFDLSAACTGFGYALSVGAKFVETGSSKHVLVIGADCLSQITDFSDRSTCVIFADGAGAAVLSAVEDGYGLQYSKLYAEGRHEKILTVENDEKENFSSEKTVGPVIKMEGRSVYKVAVDAIMRSIDTCLTDTGLSSSDIDYLILHQANLRILHAVRDRLSLSDDQMVVNIHEYGNTSAASIPIGLSELKEKGSLKKGDNVLLLGFGGGFTWATNLIRWQGGV